jgi:hypothetical protein
VLGAVGFIGGAFASGASDIPVIGGYLGGLFSRSGIRSNMDVLQNGGGLSRMRATVDEHARRAGVSLEGIDVQIVDDVDFAAYLDWMDNAVARTDQFGIQLGPASFLDEETLVRTLAHERMHVYQIKTFGQDTSSRQDMEDAAYHIEKFFVDYWRAGGGG